MTLGTTVTTGNQITFLEVNLAEKSAKRHCLSH